MSGRVPGLPSTPQDEAGLTRKFETSPVGGPTCRKTPISLSALEKNPRPGHLFEGNPVGEGTTRRGTDTPVTLKNTGSAFILFLIRNLKNLKSCLTGPDIPTVCTGFPMNPWGALASPSQRVTGASILTVTEVIILSHTGLWGTTSYEENSESEYAV